MNLSQAIRHGSYTGAVSCQYKWYDIILPITKSRILAHVCRQGGYNADDNSQRYWWTVSTSRISWEQVPPRLQSYYGCEWGWFAHHDLDDTMSYGSIDGCYKWLRERNVDPYIGWYPTKNERRWVELGST